MWGGLLASQDRDMQGGRTQETNSKAGKEQGTSVVSPQHPPLSHYPSPHRGLPVELLSLRKGTKSRANQSQLRLPN